MGASIIEKHFTLDRSGGGPDDSFSLEPAELAALCQGARTAWAALGQVDYGRKSSEQGNVKFRRSLYFVKDLRREKVIRRCHTQREAGVRAGSQAPGQRDRSQGCACGRCEHACRVGMFRTMTGFPVPSTRCTCA